MAPEDKKYISQKQLEALANYIYQQNREAFDLVQMLRDIVNQPEHKAD